MALQEATDAAGGAEATTFPPFDPSLFASQLVWFAISFAVLYFVVARFALPSVQRVVERREATVKGDIEAASIRGAEADSERKATEDAIAKARAEGRATVEAMRAKVQAELGAEQDKAEAAIAERIGLAETRIAAARSKAMTEVDGIANEIAASIVAKIAPANGAERKRA
ncbi:MAG: F0F1 ATP synthase subunit B' [Pseudomonadota bacterium]